MDIDPKIFLDVPMNVSTQHACSPPDPGPRWRGVVIRGPRWVTFKKGETVGEHGAFVAIPICGYFMVDVQPGAIEPMKLIAQDRASGRIFAGPIIELDRSPDEPPPEAPPLDPAEAKGLASGGYFNPNLADFVALPRAAGRYDVHVEFRGFQSNVVSIELVEAP